MKYRFYNIKNIFSEIVKFEEIFLKIIKYTKNNIVPDFLFGMRVLRKINR